MEEKRTHNTKKGILIGCGISALLLTGFLGSYAYFMGNLGSNKNEEVNVQTGTLALTFADGNDAITESLEFGGSVEKTFTIENTGTLDAWAKINFEDLVNTYLDGSLTFTLSYSESENGEFTDLVTNKNVPKSETSSTREIVDSLSIPVGAKYFYKLKINLNYLESTDQTDDLNAIFSTHFKLEQGSAIYTITFDDGSGETTTKDVLENATYGELPTPTKVGHTFVGWFTKPNGQGTEITSETTVNIKSNQTLYAHFKEIFTQSLISKANDISITDYNSGDKGEMYTFSHPSTSQTPALTDYRYIGASPNNYITFNDETWRIIGVFSVQNQKGVYENRIKIIREKSIGNLGWSTDNDWISSSLSEILNTADYYNRNGDFASTGLTETAKSQIAPAKWYLGGSSTYTDLAAKDYYNNERKGTSTIANVGLMYPSDYVYTYSNGVDNICYTNGYNCNTLTGGTPNKGWLYNSLSTSTEWLINHREDHSYQTSYRDENGFINIDGYVRDENAVRPVVYLRPDIEITSGDGTSAKPYTLKVSTD